MSYNNTETKIATNEKGHQGQKKFDTTYNR